MDLDIRNYSIADILSIFNIVDPTVFNVTDVANSLIAKMKADGQPKVMQFFADARDKVLDYLLLRAAEDPVENETTEEIENVWRSKEIADKNKKNPILYYEEGSHIIAAHRDAVQEADVTPILTTHFVVVDSQFRTSILPYSTNSLSNSFNTNFTFNLTNQISKVTAMTLYSYHIPTTWYAFTAQAGNTFFLYNGVIISIPDGNYSALSLASTIQAVALTNIATAGLDISYNAASNRFSMTNTDPLIGNVSVIFFIQSNVVNFSNCGNTVLTNFQTVSINSTLGWLLGYRASPNITTGDVEIILAPNVPQVASAGPDTYGPKYFTMSLEDYTNTRLSSGLYSITNTKKYTSLSATDYYNTKDVACKLREGSLTQAQLYSINAVSSTPTQNNANGAIFNNTLLGPTSGSTFATIPLQGITNLRPEPYIKFGSDVTVYTRRYINPTNIERLTVSLLDDKGNLVNLYDNDWSFTLILEERLN
jgi:hypothetical protein